ncbi:MAG: metallopeptidase family protein [Elusimicrobia bacterium]|nr:metallopeptidase family protein [Elusimicrobiota bacterium]
MKEVRVTPAKFRLMAEAELGRIPAELRSLLINVTIETKEEPGEEAEDLEDGDENDATDLLGLYCGPEREDFAGAAAHGQLPAKVYLYQWNLEDSVGSIEELQKEIRLTLRHELAHHFGFDDEELEKVWPEGA